MRYDTNVENTVTPSGDRYAHAWDTRNGVRVYSMVANSYDKSLEKWWDITALHLIWSYSSWITWIMMDWGFPGPRIFFAKRGWWGAPKASMIAHSKTNLRPTWRKS